MGGGTPETLECTLSRRQEHPPTRHQAPSCPNSRAFPALGLLRRKSLQRADQSRPHRASGCLSDCFYCETNLLVHDCCLSFTRCAQQQFLANGTPPGGYDDDIEENTSEARFAAHHHIRRGGGFCRRSGGASVCGPNIVTNGSFETGDSTGWTPAGNTAFNGVQCPGRHSRVPGDGNCDDFARAYRIEQHAFPDPDHRASVPSTISTLTSSRTVAIPAIFSAVWGAQPALLSLTNPAASAYQVLHFTAPATSTSTTLTFTFRDDPGFLMLDSVAVFVPEPGTMALLGIGVAGLWAGRRRKMQ